jgi:predicted metal-dependent HD superfamily phosphohydrolase
MLTRWQRLMERTKMHCDIHGTFHQFEDAYSEWGRYYHTLEHIDACLVEFSAVRHLASEPDAVELAIWFHDFVYDTRKSNNEGESAQKAFFFCNGAGIERYASNVYWHILATRHGREEHQPNKDDNLLVDVDLSILGQEQHVFDRYEHQIRREYEWVPEEGFRNGRAKILRGFLERESIFRTEFFRAKYEERARENLKHSLARLEASK